MPSPFEDAMRVFQQVIEDMGDEMFELVARANTRKVRGKHAKQIQALIWEIAYVQQWEHKFPECSFVICSKTKDVILYDLRARLIGLTLPLEFTLYELPDGITRELRWTIPAQKGE